MTERRKRLIEVAFPLEEVSEHSRREKNVRHGHISTLHIWWARRPLAACRAFIYASLVDDPDTDAEREELLREVADLASWDAVRHPERVVRTKDKGGSGLTGKELLDRARRRILYCNGGKPPRLLDPFAGGGAIPLEALRLGCEVEASDLNPVAVLILKATVEYAQKYGQPNSREVPNYIYEAENQRRSDQASFFDGDLVEAYRKNPLATDVRYWGNWMLERAREELAEFYPMDPDGSVPVAYLWSRTVPCPNCGTEMPLIRQYWLAQRKGREAALMPVMDGTAEVDFRIVRGDAIAGDPAKATTARGDIKCVTCKQVTKGALIRSLALAGKMGARMTCVVLEPAAGGQGKQYRQDTAADIDAFNSAQGELRARETAAAQDLAFVPDEPIAPETLGLRVHRFGVSEWGHLFNARQALTLATLAGLAADAYSTMQRHGLEEAYSQAVATYLALAVDRLADYSSVLCTWRPQADQEKVNHTFARNALSMVWDFAESNPFANSSGGFMFGLDWLARYLEVTEGSKGYAAVHQRDASLVEGKYSAVITDPPYYNAIDYAGLSDFFYVWLKRSAARIHPELVTLPLTPKREQAIMASESDDAGAKRGYVDKMASAFSAMTSAADHGIVGVVFAHTDPDAWATLIESLLLAGLVPDASWPIDTELQNKTSAATRANLQTSVWMACAPRELEVGEAFIAEVMAAMRPVIRDRLLHFWKSGIRGADFFISAIGPALSVFGRHSRVLRPDGTEVKVREFLDLVRRESTHVALEQVLQGADLGVVDPPTQQYVTWVWSYSRAPLDAGEAIALCLATGADYGEVVRPHAIAAETKEKSKKLVKLRTIKERGERDENLGLNQSARPAPLIDQLQRSAWLWSLNRQDELASYRAALGETRWQALRTLGQAVAECLPEGDEDRRLINGLLSSSVMGTTPPKAAPASLDASNGASRRAKPAPAGAMLPGLEQGGEDGS